MLKMGPVNGRQQDFCRLHIATVTDLELQDSGEDSG